MAAEEFFYLFANDRYFEELSWWHAQGSDPRFAKIDRGAVALECPPGWERKANGIWSQHSPVGQNPAGSGWKIHLAPRPHDFLAVLDGVSRVCSSEGVPFKYLRRREYLWMMNAKYAPRAASGKAIAIYPRNDAEAVFLATSLSEQFQSFAGPRVLSDLRVDNGIVHLRYGSFDRNYCRWPDGSVGLGRRDVDGSVHPDRRNVPFKMPPGHEIPEGIRDLTERATQQDGQLPPYIVLKTLHISNGGGVYLVRRSTDGLQAILKEARPFAGLDINGNDAVTRLKSELRSMRRFSHLNIVPTVYDEFSWQGHHFGVIEYIRGTTLQEWCHSKQPFLLRNNPYAEVSVEEVSAFRQAVLEKLQSIRIGVESMWSQGFVFGDHHTSNIMVSEKGEVKLIDFEACHAIDEPRPFPGALGFTRFDLDGQESDRYGLAMVELACFIPLTELKHLDANVLDRLLELVRTRYSMTGSWVARMRSDAQMGPQRPGGDNMPTPDSGLTGWQRSVVQGMVSSVREPGSRRIKGDVSGFTMPATSLAYGASGVLWSLCGMNDADTSDLRASLVEQLTQQTYSLRDDLHYGLYDSDLGASYALRRSGFTEEANAVFMKWKERQAFGGLGNPSIFSGSGGVILALLQAPVGLSESLLPDVGELFKRDVADYLERKSDPRYGHRYGLLHGAAGIALVSHRYGRKTGDESLIDMAHRLISYELENYIQREDGSYQFNDEGRRSLAYVDVGSLGAALALAEIGETEGTPPIDSLLRANGVELMAQVGMFRGRAGFLAGTSHFARLGRPHMTTFATRHLENLNIHALSGSDSCASIFYPGVKNFRRSVDFATGSAGVLTAVNFHAGLRNDWLPGIA